MIEGHIYLSMFIPPEEKVGLAIVLAGAGLVVCYCIIKGILYYIAWRERPTEVKHGSH